MTDKEIIIDGVDVAGCKHFYKKTCLAASTFNYSVSPKGIYRACVNTNCYYKQLARKKQECKELKAYVKQDLAPHAQMLNNELQTLKAENKELRTFKEKVMKPVALAMQDEPEIINIVDRYKQALDNIKPIAHDLRTRRDYHSPDEVNSDIDKILQIIEELI